TKLFLIASVLPHPQLRELTHTFSVMLHPRHCKRQIDLLGFGSLANMKLKFQEKRRQLQQYPTCYRAAPMFVKGFISTLFPANSRNSTIDNSMLGCFLNDRQEREFWNHSEVIARTDALTSDVR
ncbi:MAG: hypothetical protein ACR2QJ_01185, partial [Geminicoccaceae bacterium]